MRWVWLLGACVTGVRCGRVSRRVARSVRVIGENGAEGLFAWTRRERASQTLCFEPDECQTHYSKRFLFRSNDRLKVGCACRHASPRPFAAFPPPSRFASIRRITNLTLRERQRERGSAPASGSAQRQWRSETQIRILSRGGFFHRAERAQPDRRRRASTSTYSSYILCFAMRRVAIARSSSSFTSSAEPETDSPPAPSARERAATNGLDTRDAVSFLTRDSGWSANGRRACSARRTCARRRAGRPLRVRRTGSRRRGAQTRRRANSKSPSS